MLPSAIELKTFIASFHITFELTTKVAETSHAHPVENWKIAVLNWTEC